MIKDILDKHNVYTTDIELDLLRHFEKLRNEMLEAFAVRYQELKYPINLCADLLLFCFWSCEKTEDKKPSEIKEILLNFFTQEQIDEAIKAITN